MALSRKQTQRIANWTHQGIGLETSAHLRLLIRPVGRHLYKLHIRRRKENHRSCGKGGTIEKHLARRALSRGKMLPR